MTDATDLQENAKRELDRTNKIMQSLDIVDKEKAGSLVPVMKSYHEDCNGFFEKGQFLQSLEAAFICWAYVDAGLHMGAFKVPEEMKEIFTV